MVKLSSQALRTLNGAVAEVGATEEKASCDGSGDQEF